MEKVNLEKIFNSIAKEYVPLSIKIFICSVQLLVSTSLAQAGESKQNISTDNIGDNTKETAQLQEGGDIVTLIGFLFGKEETKVLITKKELSNLYHTYVNSRSKLGPNLEILVKDLLLNSFINILKKEYIIDGYNELDGIKDIISVLSDGKLIVRLGSNMPQNSEFNNKITIVGKQDGDKFLIEKEGGSWSFNKDDGTEMKINPKNIFEVMLSDLPRSYTQALEIIASKNNDYLLNQVELREATNKIIDLNFQIEDLKRKNIDLEEKSKAERKKAIADTENLKKEIETEKQVVISKLKELHELEIAKLNSQMNSKDTNYQSLHESFELAKIKAKELAVEKERLTNEKLAQEQLRLQELFDKEKEELNRIITILKKDIIDQVDLINALRLGFEVERANLKKLSDSLTEEITKFKGETILLNKTITTNKSIIDDNIINIADKNKKIETLKQEKENIIAQNLSVSKATTTILNQTQEKLKTSESTIVSLDTEITDLKQEVELLEKNNTDLTTETSKIEGLEAKVKDFEKALAEINTLKNTITSLNDELKLLEKQIFSLKEENKKLRTYKTKANNYDLLKGKSISKDVLTSQLEADITKKQSLIDNLGIEKEELEKEIINYQGKYSSSQLQLDEMKKKFDEITSGSIILGDDKKSDSKNATKKIETLQAELDTIKKQLSNEKASHKAELIEIEAKHIDDLEKQKRRLILD